MAETDSAAGSAAVTTAAASTAVDWRALVFAWSTYQEVQRRAQQRFPFSTSCAEEAEAFVHDQLITRAVHGRFDGYGAASTPETFLYRLISNLLEDFSRHRFGYARPPAAVRRLGALHIDAWRLLHLERMERPAASESLAARYGCSVPEADRAAREVLALCRQCGTSALNTLECGTPLDALEDAVGVPDASDTALDADLYTALLACLHAVLRPPPDGTEPTGARRGGDGGADRQGAPVWGGALARFRDALRIDDETSLILRMRFVDGRATSLIAAALGLSAKQVRHRQARGLTAIDRALKASGLGYDEMRDLLRAMADVPVEAWS